MAHTEELSDDERRARNVETLRTYFRLLADRDIDSWINLWAEDCTQLIPYSSGSLPTAVDGREAVYALYKEMAAGYSTLYFTRTEFYPMYDGDKVLARWNPHGELVDGRVYTNENVALFEFERSGRIRRFTEYFDPARFIETFGHPQPWSGKAVVR